MPNPRHPTPEGAVPVWKGREDEALKQLDAEKRMLCAQFRRDLSDVLNRERQILGLVEHAEHEIEIYY